MNTLPVLTTIGGGSAGSCCADATLFIVATGTATGLATLLLLLLADGGFVVACVL